MSTDSAHYLSTMGRAEDNLPQRADANVLGLVSLFWRHRWLLVAGTVVGVAAGVLASRLLEPKYTASTLLMLDPHEARVLNMKAVAQEFAGDTPSIETQIEVLTSRMLAERVIGELDLTADPEFNPPPSMEGEWAGYARKRLAALTEQLSPWVTSLAGETGAGEDGMAPPADSAAAPARSPAAVAEAVLETFQNHLRIHAIAGGPPLILLHHPGRIHRHFGAGIHEAVKPGDDALTQRCDGRDLLQA